jgi:hypothetical protein
MKKFSILFFLINIFLFLIFLFYLHNEPSSEALDGDLREIQAAIQAADLDASQYKGGIILNQIQLRKNILLSTEAMLNHKRKSILRKIDLIYVIESNKYSPASIEQLAAIEQDMILIQEKIKKAQDEAAKYSGGLILSTLLFNIEAQKITLTELEHKYYTSKYGIPLLTLSDGDNKNKDKPVGKIVNDKDAL